MQIRPWLIASVVVLAVVIMALVVWQELELKDAIGTLVISLIEENIPAQEDMSADRRQKVVNIAKVIDTCSNPYALCILYILNFSFEHEASE